MTPEPTRVLYIGGFGRSGSTLLERCLGQVAGFCAVGELRHVWDRSFAHNQLCGCGTPFQECAFWRAVVGEAFGGFHNVDARALVELTRQVNRTRYVPWMLFGGTAAYRRGLERFAAVLTPLYQAIRSVSGCRFIIDSSKEPSYGFILNALPTIELTVVHLVRDSRAVAFSWRKKKALPDVHWKRAYMHQYSALGSALWWTTFNALTHGFKPAGCRYLRLYYEDFARDPAAVLQRILAHVGADDGLDFIRGRAVTLAPSHTASGNPMRFQVGPIDIRPDDEWRTHMAAAERRLVTLCTLPLLLSYGYVRSSERALTGGRVRQVGA